MSPKLHHSGGANHNHHRIENGGAKSLSTTNHQKHHRHHQQHQHQEEQEQEQCQLSTKDTTTRSSTNNGYFFLSWHAIQSLPKYKYAGSDLSLIYKYILSPLAAFLVEHCTPRTIAPNAITLLGLLWMICAYCIVWFYCPHLSFRGSGEEARGGEEEEEVPRWIFAFNACAMLVYQTLDNMDGKQARRTSSSSPLGMLFDHACDAINSIFGSANWIAAMSLSFVMRHDDDGDDAFPILVLVLAPMAAFYVTTWEEYHTGKLVLPIINGPSEGLLMGAMLSVTSCVWGTSYWHETTWFDALIRPFIVPFLPSVVTSCIPPDGIRNCDVIVIATCIALGQEIIFKSIQVGRKYGYMSLLSLCPFFFMSIGLSVITMMDSSVWERNPRTFLHLTSGLFVEMVTQLMLDHMTMEKFTVLRLSLVPLGVLAALVVIPNPVMGVSITDSFVDDYLMIYTTALWTYLVIKGRLVVHEMCSVLKIWCFDIVTPYTTTTTTTANDYCDGGNEEQAKGEVEKDKKKEDTNPIPRVMNGSSRMLKKHT